MRDKLDMLIAESIAIEAEDAKQAGAVGFMARALTQATMPHRQIHEPVFRRKNGAFSLAMLAHPDVGLPYGSIPRLLVSWVTTEAVRTKSPVLELGPSLSAFMSELDLTPTGGRWGSITRLRDQMTRLFSASISCLYEEEGRTGIYNVQIVEEARLWWNPKAPDQAPLWKSTIELGKKFFDEAINRPVPVDMRALKALKRSPLALDIYCWLTYRMSYLRKPAEIPWPALQMQFGADYATQGQGPRDFKKKFLYHLRAVNVLYPEANVEEGERGLLLKPSKPHVAQLPPALPRLKNPVAPEPLLLPLPIHEHEGNTGPHLRTVTYEHAKRAAPGWDVYELERQWREWIEKKGPPKKPDAAFIAFCRKKAVREK
ncbi:MAG: replication protein RepA [Candidatus Competibacteraceae bacterium]